LERLTASLQAFGGEFFSAQSIAVGIALVVGIDRIMSEGRAMTNCIGNGRAARPAGGGANHEPRARRPAAAEGAAGNGGGRPGLVPGRAPVPA
jgi:hypothetical protein